LFSRGLKLKKTFAFISLIVVAFCCVGVFAIFYIQQWQHHEYMEELMKKNINDSELTQITLKKETDNEFSSNGKMYDVVRKHKNKNGSITYLCIEDEEEEIFLKKFSLLQKKNDNPHSVLKKVFDIKYYSQNHNPSRKLIAPNIKHQFYFSSNYLFDLNKSDVQPPEVM